eukprot:TRINITY_DN7386_c0_g1_i11.p2 TRINITY_DN7386_c0_g1~~TRINITY_DN7386_c0_g1_i11.p2  ORF type:complete len:128 (+),score=10.88 TRINITY_DN7386_c0_g1_i11:1544-1927(+)
MAADYHTDKPHLLDYGKYPDLGERRRFVEAYLKSTDTTDEEVETLLNDVERYVLASHIHWGLWGIISHHVNNIDFDYMEYARQRFQQYQLLKPKLLKTETMKIFRVHYNVRHNAYAKNVKDVSRCAP